ncbi:MAG: SprT-like domain-containing protein [Bacteroidetes bacterium]|nr:SprT-like domain-containing protein [Bacteroidota bacterium]
MHPQLNSLAEKLNPFVPFGADKMVAQLIISNNIHLTLTRQRTTKIGDYRPPQKGKGHRITINKNLNKFSFLITFIHELSHLTCWNDFQNKVLPHGTEWKNHFKRHMTPFLNNNFFPEIILNALIKYMNNPAASSCADINLMKSLQMFEPDDGLKNLEELEENSIFSLDGNKIFKKGALERKRYKCYNLTNKKYYLVSAIARVKKIEKTD